jgi:hypothetical protein
MSHLGSCPAPGRPKYPLFSVVWHALLDRVSRPFWARRQPAPQPLWAIPGETPKDILSGYPHGDAIRGLLSRYATVLGVPVSFRTGAGRYSRPDSGHALHIHTFAVPTPASLFGFWPRVPLVLIPFVHGVPLREGARWIMGPGTQFGRGRLLFDPDGYAVGEHVGTNLYCLFDLLGQEPAWIPLLLRRLLDAGLPRLLPALKSYSELPADRWSARLRLLQEETEALVRAGRQTLHREAKKAYARECRERVTDEMRFLEADIAFLEEGVEEIARRITTDSRRLKEGRRRLEQLQGRRGCHEPSDGDLERLKNLPEVREVGILDGRFRVTTFPILVGFEGRRYRLGSFQIDLSMDGDVRIMNVSNRIGPYDHPHICQGRPRLGSIREGIAKLLGESQFAASTEVLIDFLKTVNPADWRQHVGCWPETESEALCGVPTAA